MFQKIKNAVLKKGKRVIAGVMAVAASASILAVGAFAADTTEGSGSNMATIVESAGTSLTAEFSNLVMALVPLLIGIAMVGLGLYAVIYLFKMAKKFFGQAAS